jgi:hypothetical protein
MNLLVCGGREYKDREQLFAVLDSYRIFPRLTIIHGDARGADRLAGEWARERGVPVRAFPADWNQHGKNAGPIRNAQMIREGQPDAVVAFPGGRGTDDMVRQASRAGITVLRITPSPTTQAETR